MHVAVEEAVAEHLVEEDLGRLRHDPVGIEPGRDQGVALVGGMAGDPLHGQHPAAGPLPVHSRHAKALVVAAVLRQLDRGRRLEAEIDLAAGRGGEDVDHLDRLVVAKLRLGALDQSASQAKKSRSRSIAARCRAAAP